MVYQVNNHSIMGYLGRDPDIRHSQSGKIIASFSVATTAKWKSKITGELEERTSWHRVVVFREASAKFVQNHLRKGSLVFVQGTPQTREYTNEEGEEKSITEIVVSGPQSQVMLPDPFAWQLSVGKIVSVPSLGSADRGEASPPVGEENQDKTKFMEQPKVAKGKEESEDDLKDEKIPF